MDTQQHAVPLAVAQYSASRVLSSTILLDATTMHGVNACICSHRDHKVHSAAQDNHLQQFLGAIGRSDAKLLQQLHHEATEALECARQPYLRVYLDQHIPRCVHIHRLHTSHAELRIAHMRVSTRIKSRDAMHACGTRQGVEYLDLASFVEWAVQDREQRLQKIEVFVTRAQSLLQKDTMRLLLQPPACPAAMAALAACPYLMRNIRPVFCGILSVTPQVPHMIVAVQQLVGLQPAESAD